MPVFIISIVSLLNNLVESSTVLGLRHNFHIILQIIYVKHTNKTKVVVLSVQLLE